MGVVTISVSDEAEHEFRRSVKARYGEGKGKLGKAVEEAIKNWVEYDKSEEAVKKAIALMKKGAYRVGKNYTFRREEAYG